jgi:hypothetical protein
MEQVLEMSPIQQLPWEHIAQFLTLERAVCLSSTCKWLNRRMKTIDLTQLEPVLAWGCIDAMLGYAQAWPLAPLMFRPLGLEQLDQLLHAAEAGNTNLFGLELSCSANRCCGPYVSQFLSGAEARLLKSPLLSHLRALTVVEPFIEDYTLADWSALFSNATKLH